MSSSVTMTSAKEPQSALLHFVRKMLAQSESILSLELDRSQEGVKLRSIQLRRINQCGLAIQARV